jgi:hypothetical protein
MTFVLTILPLVFVLCTADLEQLLFELSVPAAAAATIPADGLQLSLYQGLLCELQCTQGVEARQQQDVLPQQHERSSSVQVQVKDESTWQVTPFAAQKQQEWWHHVP